MITIYHNPRCSKSREGLLLLEKSGKEFRKVLYLEDNLSFEQLSELIKKLDIKPIELVRKNEVIWKENFKDKSLTDKQVIEAMVAYPNLIERPIVVNNNSAVIGRPASKITDII